MRPFSESPLVVCASTLVAPKTRQGDADAFPIDERFI